jgi:hypothetical protein
MWIMPGREKASVLPDPVSATPIRSRPEAMIGQHWPWIEDGFSKSLQTVITRGSSLKTLKFMIGL